MAQTWRSGQRIQTRDSRTFTKVVMAPVEARTRILSMYDRLNNFESLCRPLIVLPLQVVALNHEVETDTLVYR